LYLTPFHGGAFGNRQSIILFKQAFISPDFGSHIVGQFKVALDCPTMWKTKKQQ